VTDLQVGLMVAGVVLLALVLLVAALWVLSGRTRPFLRAVRRLGWRAEEAQKLQAKVALLQDRVASLPLPATADHDEPTATR
jgi:Na+-transporting methylmalonyl-CoA/oxaloacetate decarboxylase gamma subunit